MDDKGKLLDVILDNISVCCVSADSRGRITEVIRSAPGIPGLSVAGLTGMLLDDLFLGLSLEKRSQQTFPFRTDQNTLIFVGVTVIPAEDSTGHIVLIQEVTELNSLRSELSAARDLIEVVKNETPDIIILKDPDGKWLEWNRKAESLLASQASSDNEIPYLSPVCADSDKEAWASARFVRVDEKLPDGQVYDVLKIPIRRNDGSPLSMLTMARDVTGRSLREKKIERLHFIVNMLRSVDRLILETEDLSSLVEQIVKVLTESGPFTGSVITVTAGDTEIRFASGSSSRHSGSTISRPLEYKGISYGSLLAVLSETESPEEAAELTEILAELAQDIGFAIHGILLSSQREEAKSMLDSFLENIPGIAFIRDSHSRYLRMNKNCYELFDEPDWFGKDPEDLYRPDVQERLVKRDKEVLEKGYICRERVFHKNDGTDRIYEGHYFSVLRPGEEPLIGGIGLEITDRLKAERSLVESEERYRTIYESTVNAMALLGTDGVVVSANSNVEELTGYVLDEIIDKMTWVDFVHPEDLQSVAEQRKRRLAGDSSSHQEYEFRLIRKDGSVRNIRMRTGTIPNSGGMGVISLSDITSLITYQKQLNRSLNKTKAILDAIPDLMFVLSREGTYLGLHAGNENKLYYDPSEIAGKGIFDIGLPEEVAEEMLDTISDTLESGKVNNVAYMLELPDGKHFYESGIAPFEKDKVLVLCRDVTGRKEAEEEQKLLQARVQHVQKLESLGVLAGGIAHDFNNILMAISGNTQLALEAGRAGENIEQYLQVIDSATERAADLASQMLAYSGRGEFKIAPLDLNTVVNEISDMLRITVSTKAVMSFEPGEDLPLILADATQIRQVFMNLITNASEALQGDPGTIDVSTGVIYCDEKYAASLELLNKLTPGHYVYVEVRDSGAGMSREIRQSIFNPFFTTKFTGRGLGLSAVLGIMNSHKGAIEIDSEPGKGSTFRALFPAIKEDAFNQQEAEQTQIDPLLASGTVMFVDDEPLVRAVVETMLKQFGFNVITAVDGIDCLNKFKENITEVDLVILDITMPNMDGDEAFRVMRKLRKDIPVIISSGYSELEVLGRFPDEYPDGFIQKPYSAEKLKSKIHSALKQ